jgi:hypothetical protein
VSNHVLEDKNEGQNEKYFAQLKTSEGKNEYFI